MLLTILILATFMAVFSVLGYRQGTRASFVVLAVTLIGMLIISRGGALIAGLFNGIYFGLLFVFNGGLQALASGSGWAQAAQRVIQTIGPVPPLIDPHAPGPALTIILLLLVALSFLLTRLPALRLGGPSSGWGMAWGLIAGYLLGGYFLVKLFPVPANYVWLPFGLAVPATPPVTTPGGAAVGTGAAWNQTVNWVLAAPQRTLSIIVGSIIVMFILIAGLASTAGAAGGARRNGAN
jgi:hypothetical protein